MRQPDDVLILKSRQALEMRDSQIFKEIQLTAEKFTLDKILETDDIEDRERWVQRRKGIKFFYSLIESCINLGTIVNKKAEAEQQKEKNESR